MDFCAAGQHYLCFFLNLLGVPLAHIATAQDPTPWLDRYVPENVQFDIFFPTTRRIRADPSLVQMLKDEISINAVRSVRDNLVQDTRGVNTPGDDAINDRPSLCQIHTAKCPLVGISMYKLQVAQSQFESLN